MQSGQSASAKWMRGYDDPSALKPRAKMGLQLYAQGICPSLRAASTAVGFHPQYLTVLAGTPAGREFMENAHQIISKGLTDKHALVQALGMRALQVASVIMEDAPNDGIRLKAAQDLMDRDPDLSKVQKHQVESFTLSGKDAKDLAAALTSASAVREVYSDLVHQNFNRLTAEDSTDAA